MANWPTYSITAEGNDSAIREIEDILRGQSRYIHCEYIADIWEYGKSRISVSGETPWGVHDFDRIVRIVEANELDLKFHQGDMIGNTEIIGEWEKGKEKEWKVGYYEDWEVEDYEEDDTPTNNSESPLVDTDDPLPF